MDQQQLIPQSTSSPSLEHVGVASQQDRLANATGLIVGQRGSAAACGGGREPGRERHCALSPALAGVGMLSIRERMLASLHGPKLQEHGKLLSCHT